MRCSGLVPATRHTLYPHEDGGTEYGGRAMAVPLTVRE